MLGIILIINLVYNMSKNLRIVLWLVKLDFLRESLTSSSFNKCLKEGIWNLILGRWSVNCLEFTIIFRGLMTIKSFFCISNLSKFIPIFSSLIQLWILFNGICFSWVSSNTVIWIAIDWKSSRSFYTKIFHKITSNCNRSTSSAYLA